MKKSDETVEAKGFKGFSNVFGKRKRQLKITVDEATFRAIVKEVGGASEKQRVRMYGSLRQCHIDRR